MSSKFDYNLLSEMMTNANMGWWEADLSTESYICSENISELLGLSKDGIISFEDFNNRILKEEQRHTSAHSFDNIQEASEAVYLLNTVQGPIWVRSKACLQKTDENGNLKVYGIAEMQDGPDMSSASRVLQEREQLLHNIYKSLPVGIELYNMEGVLIDLNDKEIEMFHLQRKEDLLGINIFENPIFPEEMKAKLRKYEDADFTFRYDFSKVGNYYKNLKKTGTMDLVTKVTTLYDDHCNPTNYLLINADKTEATIAYNKIQEFENFFELIGDYAKVGYAHYNILSQEGYAQHSWYKNVGEKEETPLCEIVGSYKHFHPEDRAAIADFLNKAEKGLENKLSREVRVLREDGTITWLRTHLIVRNYAPEDNVIEIISINYDITQLKRTEAMLIQAKEKAEESDRLKSAFLANMSHEIRTPLNAIIGFSSLLQYVDDNDEREQYISLINRNNELLLNLINDVLDLSKIEAGRMELHTSWFDLSKLINESITEHEQYVPDGVTLTAKVPAHACLVEHDPMRIKQILNNFISNALKNTTQGRVEVSYEVNDSGIKISVADTGRGIPEDKIDKIFERFEKVDSFVQGAGLGLSICKTIAEKLNGIIKVDSTLGVGSTFSVELPCRTKTVE
ncbi:PAS domain-containing sensor histidine kinase [Bacteroides sp.]|uniref:PAS domain-containing sensor histidine kinase n=1 Tax=Bacteroides sp. TaxID=29523 RepID=UPI003AB69DA2